MNLRQIGIAAATGCVGGAVGAAIAPLAAVPLVAQAISNGLLHEAVRGSPCSPGSHL